MVVFDKRGPLMQWFRAPFKGIWGRSKAGLELILMAVSTYGGSFLWVSSEKQAYYFGSTIGSLIFEDFQTSTFPKGLA